MVLGLSCFLGCASPARHTVLNWITPDRLGAGVSNGTMNAYGVSNKFFRNQPTPMEMDIDGETHGTSIWLEWDFPQWEEKPNYDEYLRERVRTLQLEKILLQKEQEIEQPSDEDTSCLEYLRGLGQDRMWPFKLTEQYYI